MKLKDILIAVPALQKLAAAELTLKIAYELQQLNSALQNDLDFFDREKAKIVNRLGEIKGNEPEITELLNMDVNTEIHRVKIPLTETEHVKLSANDINAVRAFVDFEGEK